MKKKSIITVLIYFYWLCVCLVCGIIFSGNALAQTLRISPEQLKQQLIESQVPKSELIILDARTPEAYTASHIKGAVNFPIDLTYHNKKKNGKISKPALIQTLFRARGITTTSPVVVYDSGKILDAARLFWVLEVYGLTNVKVLDHGYDYWRAQSYPIDFKSTKVKPSQYIAALNHQRLASKFTTQLATHNTNQIVIDARKKSDYIGTTSTAKRFGHIPTAIHVAASHHLSSIDQTLHLKPLNELQQLYSSIPKNKKVIIYCAIGRISSTNYLALRELGYDVSNYDASWNEWGNDERLPIEK